MSISLGEGVHLKLHLICWRRPAKLPANFFCRRRLMRFDGKAILAFLLSAALVILPSAGARAAGAYPAGRPASAASTSTDIRSHLQRRYGERFVIAGERM